MNIINIAKSTFNKTKFFINKNSVPILIGTGIVAGIAATGTAINATLKVHHIIDDYNENMKKIDKARWIIENDADIAKNHSIEEVESDLRLVKIQTVANFLRLYAPTVALTAISVTSILWGCKIASARYAGVVAAYGALSTQFTKYREDVKTQIGDKKELDIYNGVVEEKQKEGQKTITKRTVKKEPYAKFFDEFSPIWDKNYPDLNVTRLLSVSADMNDRLRADGHLFLNDVYRAFGLPDTSDGAVIGWLFNDKHKGHVDLGVFDSSNTPWDISNNCPWDGKNGIRIIPNPDGIIFDRF